MTIYNAYLIKGYLIDKKAPKRIMEALDTLIGTLHGTEGKQAQGGGATAATGSDGDSSEDAEEDPLPPVEIPADTEPPALPLIEEEPQRPAEKTARKKNLSPEQREAAAQRMRDMWARKRGQVPANVAPADPAPAKPPYEIRKATPPAPAPAPAPKPKVEPSIDVDRLITVHAGYAGKRDDRLLVDSDWPDIKARLAKGEDRKAIAGDYDVELEDLDYFIASSQRREAKQPPGEALASPSGGASGAARTKW